MTFMSVNAQARITLHKFLFFYFYNHLEYNYTLRPWVLIYTPLNLLIRYIVISYLLNNLEV